MNLEWAHVVVAIVSAIFGGGMGLAAGVWKVARIEGQINEKFNLAIANLKDELEDKVEGLVPKFEESFKAMRQKIGDVELNTERFFLSKDGFNDFRKEYREDFSNLMKKIDHLTGRADL